MFLICGKILDLEDIGAVAQRLGLYIVTVVTGLVLHACITLPAVYFLFTRKNPLILMKAVFQAWLTALATASRYVKRKMIKTADKKNSSGEPVQS